MEVGRLKQFLPRGEALDPLIAGREEYLNFYGRLSQERDSWKKATFYILGIFFVMTIGMVYISTRSEFIPFMLLKDTQTGYVQALGPVTETKYVPEEAEITYFLWDVVQKIRSVPLDPVVYKANWTAASAFLTEKTSQKINFMIEEEGQKLQLGKATVQPALLSIQPLANTKNTYQVRWTEEVFSFNGSNQKNTTTYCGNFTVSIDSPKTKAAYYTNPIGMKIEDCSWRKENNVNPQAGGGHTNEKGI